MPLPKEVPKTFTYSVKKQNTFKYVKYLALYKQIQLSAALCSEILIGSLLRMRIKASVSSTRS